MVTQQLASTVEMQTQTPFHSFSVGKVSLLFVFPRQVVPLGVWWRDKGTDSTWHQGTVDQPRPASLRYAIDRDSDLDQIFDINADTGAIVTGKGLDRETAGWHNITVLAMEAGEPGTGKSGLGGMGKGWALWPSPGGWDHGAKLEKVGKKGGVEEAKANGQEQKSSKDPKPNAGLS